VIGTSNSTQSTSMTALCCILTSLLLLPTWLTPLLDLNELRVYRSGVTVCVPINPGDCQRCQLELGEIIHRLQARCDSAGLQMLTVLVIRCRRESEMAFVAKNLIIKGKLVHDATGSISTSLRGTTNGTVAVVYYGRKSIKLTSISDLDLVRLNKH
jgi:hypothetical protein